MVGSVVLLLERPSMHKADALASVLVAALVISAVCRVADQEQVDYSGWTDSTDEAPCAMVAMMTRRWRVDDQEQVHEGERRRYGSRERWRRTYDLAPRHDEEERPRAVVVCATPGAAAARPPRRRGRRREGDDDDDDREGGRRRRRRRRRRGRDADRRAPPGAVRAAARAAGRALPRRPRVMLRVTSHGIRAER